MHFFLISDPDQDKKYLTSLVTASTAGCLIAIMTVFAVLLSCGSCCDSPSCSRSMYRFALAYILLDVLACEFLLCSSVTGGPL